MIDKNEQLREMREEYDSAPLRKRDLKDCPLEQFSLWLEEAVGAGIPDSNACSLASVDDDSRPVARAVLLKGLEDGCFVFYTNFNSRKAVQLRKSPWASMHFPWFSMQRQVVVTGKVILGRLHVGRVFPFSALFQQARGMGVETERRSGFAGDFGKGLYRGS